MRSNAFNDLANYLSRCQGDGIQPASESPLYTAATVQLLLTIMDVDSWAIDVGAAVGEVMLNELEFIPQASDLRLSCWDSDDKPVVAEINYKSGRVRTLTGEADFSRESKAPRCPDGFFYTDREHFISVFRSDTDEKLFELRDDFAPGELWNCNIVFSPDSSVIAVSYCDHSVIRFWSTKDGSFLGDVTAAQSEANIAFSPDGRFFFAATRAGLQVFFLPALTEVFSRMAKPGQHTWSGVFSSDRAIVAYCEKQRGADLLIHVLDLSTIVSMPSIDLRTMVRFFEQNRGATNGGIDIPTSIEDRKGNLLTIYACLNEIDGEDPLEWLQVSEMLPDIAAPR